MNDAIINEFKKMEKQIKFEIDHAKNSKEKIGHGFRLKATRDVIDAISNLNFKVKSVDQLKNVKGIGKKSLARIEEILNSGKLAEIDDDIINDDYQKHIEELEEVFGIGRKTAFNLFTKHKVKSINELKELYANGEIELPDNIVKGLKYVGKSKENIPREEVDKIADRLQKIVYNIDNELVCIICGSYRRLKLTSNDIDVLIVHPKLKTKDDLEKKKYLRLFVGEMVKDGLIVDAYTSYDVSTKFMGLIQLTKKKPIRRIDIRYIPYESLYYAMLYFTGPGDFNKKMRQLAEDLGYKLNEYGLFDNKTGKSFLVKSEKEIFDILGMEYLEPQNRK